MRKGKQSVTRSSVEQTVAMSSSAIADHELTVLGVGNVNRYFDTDDYSNAPSCIFRHVDPYAAITQGFSTGSISDQDVGAALDVTEENVTTPLYPITDAAKVIESDVWPVVKTLMESGTGQRHSVSISEFVRYVAMVHASYDHLRWILTINVLAYHFDWTKVAPYSDTVPSHIYKLAEAYNATDVGLASKWLPLFRRLETKILFPRLVEELKRVTSPTIAPGISARLIIPVPVANLLNDADHVEKRVTDWLDYVETRLPRTSAMMNSFFPFNISAQNPWSVEQFGGIDVHRELGMWNSGVAPNTVFGDTDDPHPGDSLIVVTDKDSDQTVEPALWHTHQPQPTWAEVRQATIYNLHSNTLDDTWQLVTPHKYGTIIFMDDFDGYVEYDGSVYTDLSANAVYEHFANSRFVNQTKGINGGTMRDGVIGAELNYLPMKRIMRSEVRYMLHIELLVSIAQKMAGASLRELRATIAQAVSAEKGSVY